MAKIDLGFNYIDPDYPHQHLYIADDDDDDDFKPAKKKWLNEIVIPEDKIILFYGSNFLERTSFLASLHKSGEDKDEVSREGTHEKLYISPKGFTRKFLIDVIRSEYADVKYRINFYSGYSDIAIHGLEERGIFKNTKIYTIETST